MFLLLVPASAAGASRVAKAAATALKRLSYELDDTELQELLRRVLAGHVAIDSHTAVVAALEDSQLATANALWWAKLLGTAAALLAAGGACLHLNRKRRIADLQAELLGLPMQLRRATLAEQDARVSCREARHEVLRLRSELTHTTDAKDSAEGELNTLAAAQDLSQLQPAFDDAMAQADATNTPLLSAKLFDALAVFARDLGAADLQATARARTIKASNGNFQRRVRDAQAHSRILESLGYKLVGDAKGGSWQMATHVFEARRAAKFFPYCAARLSERCGSVCSRLADDLALKFLEIVDARRDGILQGSVAIEWTEFDRNTAGAITMQVLKMGLTLTS